MNANIMKAKIVQRMKYDLKGQYGQLKYLFIFFKECYENSNLSNVIEGHIRSVDNFCTCLTLKVLKDKQGSI